MANGPWHGVEVKEGKEKALTFIKKNSKISKHINRNFLTSILILRKNKVKMKIKIKL